MLRKLSSLLASSRSRIVGGQDVVEGVASAKVTQLVNNNSRGQVTAVMNGVSDC